jgi:hypothetical protein
LSTSDTFFDPSHRDVLFPSVFWRESISAIYQVFRMQIILTVLLVTAYSWLGTKLYEWQGWTIVPYILLTFVAAWFVQTEEERERTRAFWRRFI